MRPERRPFSCFAWLAVSAWLAACSGDETIVLHNSIVCMHPNDDALARLAEDELERALLPEGAVRDLARSDTLRIDNEVGNDVERGVNSETPAPPLTVGFSRTPGFHLDGFDLELEASDEQADIYYTLDGSAPNRDLVLASGCAPSPGDFHGRTYRYSGPIDLSWWLTRPNHLSLVNAGTIGGGRSWIMPAVPVAKAAVVRMQAARGDRVSPLVSGTFFVAAEGRGRYTLPVISLAADPADLFDEKEGIYVPGPDPEVPNFAQRGDDWERPAHFELFNAAGERPVSQDVGIRVHGNFSRSFPQKSLRLYARKEYGRSQLEHQFFDSKDTRAFKRLLLRNGGNDWGQTLFRDAAMQSLVQHLPLETQHAQPAVVFINGEYWGLHILRDRLDKFHFEIRYGIPREQIAILERDAWLVDGSEADVADYSAFLNELTLGNLSEPEAIDRHIALPELLDYTILQTYAGNTDWPHNNISYYRYSGPHPSEERGPRDGRWRMLVFDLDRTFGRNYSLEVDMIDRLFGQRQGDWSRQLFHGFIAIDAIRHEFIQRTALHLATTFASDRVEATIERFLTSIEPEMPDHIDRWNRPESMDEFYADVELSHEFAAQRPRSVRQHMVSFFEEIAGLATVRIHNIDPDQPPTLHGIRLSPEMPGVSIQDGVWEAPVFAGVPLILQSGGTDMSDVAVSGAMIAGASAEHLELMLEVDAHVDVHLPQRDSTPTNIR